MRITISKENYLKAIAEAEGEGETVIAATLARWLKVSAPAVTMAIRRLKRDGLIHVSAAGEITLKKEGREIANRVLQRHHLIERMLTEIFGMEWYKVHDEAEQLEHAVSADFERRLIEKLGPSEACPHGNQARVDRPQDRRDRGWTPLDELDAGVVFPRFKRFDVGAATNKEGARVLPLVARAVNVPSAPEPSAVVSVAPRADGGGPSETTTTTLEWPGTL